MYSLAAVCMICLYHPHFVECILRNISYENYEIQKIRFTILLAYGIIRVLNAVGECLFALVDFKHFFKLSCHSIFVELFVSISMPYKFTIHIEKHF
jgi:uncharacterized membrane protein (DUF2068 family)